MMRGQSRVERRRYYPRFPKPGDTKLRNTYICRLSRRPKIPLAVNLGIKMIKNFYRQIYRQKSLLESRRDVQ